MFKLKKLLPSKLGRQISFVVVGDAITTMAVFVSGMILARVISKEEMGTYRQIQYLVLFTAGIVELGLSTTIYRFWNTLTEIQRASYLRMLMVVSAGLCVAGGLVLAVLAPILANSYENPSLLSLLPIAAIVPLATVPIKFIRPVLISQGHSLKATGLETVFALVPVLAIVIPATLGYPIETSILLWVGASVIRLVAVPMVLWSYVTMRKAPFWDKGIFSSVWEFIWPIQVSRIPGLLMAYLDKVIMSVFLTPAGFAVYYMGARQLPFIGSIGPSVSSVLVPNLTVEWEKGNIEPICRRWRKAAIRTALITYPVAAFCIWHAVPIMKFLFSAEYEESAVPFRFFAAITFVMVIEYASLAKVMNETKLIVWSAIGSFAAFIILSFVLTWQFGVAGMASSVLLARVFSASIFLAFYKKRLAVRLFSLFPLLELIIVFGVAVCATVLGSMALETWLPISSDEMLELALYLALYFSVAAIIFVGIGYPVARILPKRIFSLS